MWHEVVLDREFFVLLVGLDLKLAQRVREEGCSRCGGPLCAGHYARKPRGGLLALVGDEPELARRFSLCCAREGCRKRAMPPSVRFLGRKVYLEAVIVMACVVAPLLEQTARALREATGIALRTVRRWQSWWRTVFTASSVWVDVRARAPMLEPASLPLGLIELVEGSSATDQLLRTMKLLSPLTTKSVDGTRFLREER